MNSTASRVPRITALPARILGPTTMRSDSGVSTVYLVDEKSSLRPAESIRAVQQAGQTRRLATRYDAVSVFVR